jgi:hypothetical protein
MLLLMGVEVLVEILYLMELLLQAADMAAVKARLVLHTKMRVMVVLAAVRLGALRLARQVQGRLVKEVTAL